MAGEIKPEEVFDECNERLDVMVNNLVTIARQQKALALGPKDLIKMRNTFEKTISTYMMPYLAASAVLRLVNFELLSNISEMPNT